MYIQDSSHLTERNQTVENVTVITVFLSVITQLPMIFENPWFKSAGTLVWVLLLAVLVLNQAKLVLHPVLFLPILFDVWIIISEIVSGFRMRYMNANLFRPVNMCVFILEIGWMLSRFYSQDFFKKIAKAYIYASTIFAAVIYVQYFMGKQITGNTFLYLAKNSAASIVLCALIMLFLMKREVVPKKSKFLWFMGLIFYTVVLIYMQSRTVLLCAACALVWYVFFVEKRLWVKLLIIALCIGAVYFVLNNEAAYETIVENLLLNGKEADDLNGISSGRIDHFAYFKQIFPEAMIMGRGGTYIESFPLAALASFGIVGASILFLFMLFPIVTGVRLIYTKKAPLLGIVIIAVSISILINSMAEELPPYGPGVKCFLMWFLAGFGLNADRFKPSQIHTSKKESLTFLSNIIQ